MHKPIVYLACPYTHPDFNVRVERFTASARAAADLIKRGMFVYSPITMTHPIDLVLAQEQGSMGSDYWCDFDEAFMNVCSEMIILSRQHCAESRPTRRDGCHVPVNRAGAKFARAGPKSAKGRRKPLSSAASGRR